MTELSGTSFEQAWSDLLAYAQQAQVTDHLIPSIHGRGGNFVVSVDDDGIAIVARRRGTNPNGRIVGRATMQQIWNALVTDGYDDQRNHAGRFHQVWWMLYVDAFDDVALDIHNDRWVLRWYCGDNTALDDHAEVGGNDEHHDAPLAIERAAKTPPTSEKSDSSLRLLEFDPSLLERGLRAHWEIEEALSRLIAKRGHIPLQPIGEPDFDIAWNDGETFHVIEVKSITDANETAQLRLGLGQVLHYQHQIVQRGGEFNYVRAILAIELEPTDTSWYDVCAEAGVDLVVAPRFRGLFPRRLT